MNWLLAIPWELRLIALFVFGTCLGSLANLAVYRLAWQPRAISPWGRANPQAPPRRRSDRLPVLGWLGLRRESNLHGTGFWIRPMLLELFCGFGCAALYWWEIGCLGLLPPDAPLETPAGVLAVLHTQYAAHLLLFFAMLVASVIDIDEKTIPDLVTVPVTLAGLLLAAACPWSLLPGLITLDNTVALTHPWESFAPNNWPLLRLTSLNGWPDWLDGFPRTEPLLIALGCWWLWCVALLPWTWYSRHGWRRAARLCCARLIRSGLWTVLIGVLGAAGIAAVWYLGGPRWAGLLGALVGMVAGGGLIWLLRLLGSPIMQREVMGFGDVTLMAMIGSFLGWQACLMVFFIAPLAGLLVGVPQWLLIRDQEIYYGPFLCLAAGVVVLWWAALWDWAWPIFSFGWLVPAIVFCLLTLVFPCLLLLVRAIKVALLRLVQ